jgi:hypothetical protein
LLLGSNSLTEGGDQLQSRSDNQSTGYSVAKVEWNKVNGAHALKNTRQLKNPSPRMQGGKWSGATWHNEGDYMVLFSRMAVIFILVTENLKSQKMSFFMFVQDVKLYFL